MWKRQIKRWRGNGKGLKDFLLCSFYSYYCRNEKLIFYYILKAVLASAFYFSIHIYEVIRRQMVMKAFRVEDIFLFPSY